MIHAHCEGHGGPGRWYCCQHPDSGWPCTETTVERPWEPQSRIPLHRAGDDAMVARCSTCDGGGCLDCTDPA